MFLPSLQQHCRHKLKNSEFVSAFYCWCTKHLNFEGWILHKLTKLHHQTVLLLLKLFSKMCFVFHRIWWWDDIWISGKLKFDYSEKEKKFRSEIKNIFPFFTISLVLDLGIVHILRHHFFGHLDTTLSPLISCNHW